MDVPCQAIRTAAAAAGTEIFPDFFSHCRLDTSHALFWPNFKLHKICSTSMMIRLDKGIDGDGTFASVELGSI